MKRKRIITACLAASARLVLALARGCDREVSHTSSTTVHDDGTVKTKDKTVTVSPDGNGHQRGDQQDHYAVIRGSGAC